MPITTKTPVAALPVLQLLRTPSPRRLVLEMACVAVSESDCEAMASAAGLQFGGSGTGFNTKGCYAYNASHPTYGGKVYYGSGASESDQMLPVFAPRYRPQCEGNSSLTPTISVELAPVARQYLADHPSDQTIGIVRYHNGTQASGVFFKPIPNSPTAGTAQAGNDRHLGLKAAMPVTFSVPVAGEYMLGIHMRKGCEQFRLRGSTFDPNESPKCLYPCDQCQRMNLGCIHTNTFFVCSSDPRDTPTNPATSFDLQSCDKHHHLGSRNGEPRGRVYTFPADQNITLYLAARETCTVAGEIKLYNAQAFPTVVYPRTSLGDFVFDLWSPPNRAQGSMRATLRPPPHARLAFRWRSASGYACARVGSDSWLRLLARPLKNPEHTRSRRSRPRSRPTTCG